MKKIGLFFGSFNPIHIGHLIIANHLAEFSDLDEIWLVVTPHNPHKKKNSLLDNRNRFYMVYEATKNYPKLKPSDIEFHLPQPNYTIHTLIYLEEKYVKKYKFSLIMGEDNLKTFHKWKNYEEILAQYHIYVYPRILESYIPDSFVNHPKITKIDAPIIQISSSFIRTQHKENKNIRPLLPNSVWKYMDEMNFYRS